MNYLRPEEKAAEHEIEKAKKRDLTIKKAVRSVGALASTALGAGATIGAGIQSKILPFLSSHLPVDLAVKGINKISPQLGTFLKKGMEQGLDVKEGLDYIKKSMTPKNVIEEISPALHQFLQQEISKGKKWDVAGALATLPAHGFTKDIEKIRKKTGMPWENVLMSIFGDQSQAALQQQNPEQIQQETQQEQPKQEGPGTQALRSALQRLAELRKGS